MKTYLLEVTPQELDFICTQMIQGQRDFATFKNIDLMVNKLAAQANSDENKARMAAPETDVKAAVRQALERRQPRPANPNQTEQPDLKSALMGAAPMIMQALAASGHKPEPKLSGESNG